ncbi:hypothetical protein [Kitasatospora camelliae]|uniref:Uncharacterized protein n=1 Tax=Kitasatospora camelliae TaxID=3156397 RepID=A0AAU8K6P2_9ACTN
MDNTSRPEGLAQYGAAVRAAREQYAAADADAKTAWNRWYGDPTDENWTPYEQASAAAVGALRALRALEDQPLA